MKHSSAEALEALDLAWDPERGVLGKLRDGIYDAELAQEYITLLESIEIEEGEHLHPDFVRLLWFSPIFSEWQSKRIAEFGSESDKLDSMNFANKVLSRVERILGIP
ncbi:hypothetical protein ACFW4X_27705 [Streptomyces smyrnaeus]|uniref:Uncharacterized protein n=1 Tax=Streptomyces smyrnaeus TaxID=1387713 RepID=A0ABS3Y1C2_9ACTN|nr:hypothetical protein [Streptomyces smyrnaeus]MBO8201450.1 hypothetical protein [Streptomyces smyrnaeus]